MESMANAGAARVATGMAAIAAFFTSKPDSANLCATEAREGEMMDVYYDGGKRMLGGGG